jgi:hypothetical protein
MSKTRHPFALTVAGFIFLLACANYGTAALLFVGIPGFLILLGIAGGARMPTKVPARDTLAYVGISVGVVAIVLLLAVYAARTNRDIFDLNNRWTTIIFGALFSFGSVIKNCRDHRHRAKFWLIFAALLAAHFMVLPHLFPVQIPFLLAAPALALGEIFVLYVLFGISGFPLTRSQSRGAAASKHDSE